MVYNCCRVVFNLRRWRPAAVTIDSRCNRAAKPGARIRKKAVHRARGDNTEIISCSLSFGSNWFMRRRCAVKTTRYDTRNCVSERRVGRTSSNALHITRVVDVVDALIGKQCATGEMCANVCRSCQQRRCERHDKCAVIAPLPNGRRTARRVHEIYDLHTSHVSSRHDPRMHATRATLDAAPLANGIMNVRSCLVSSLSLCLCCADCTQLGPKTNSITHSASVQRREQRDDRSILEDGRASALEHLSVGTLRHAWVRVSGKRAAHTINARCPSLVVFVCVRVCVVQTRATR